MASAMKILIFLLLFLSGLSTCLKGDGVKFVEKLTIGSEERAEETFIKIIDAISDPAGNIFIVDSGDNSIKKFSREGMFLKKMARTGQGPGELSTPLGADLDKNGSLYVNDYDNRRINVYTNDLDYVDTIPLKSSLVVEDLYITLDGNLLILSSPHRTGQKYFNLFSREGDMIRSFFEEFHPFAPPLEGFRPQDRTFPYLLGKANMSLDKKKLAFSHNFPENPYKIFFLDLKGNILDVIPKKIKGYSPQKQKESLTRLQRDEKDYVYTTITGLHFSPEGYLIVERTDVVYQDGTLDRTMRRLDVFSPDGRLVREDVQIEGDIMSIDHENRVYVRIEPEDGLPKLTVYSLEIN